MGTASREQHRDIPAHRVPPLGPWRKREHAPPPTCSPVPWGYGQDGAPHHGNDHRGMRHPPTRRPHRRNPRRRTPGMGGEKKTETNSLGNILQILAQ